MPGPGPISTPELLWQVDTPDGIAALPLVDDGAVVTVGEDGHVRVLDGAVGRESWTVSLPSGTVSTPTIADRTLYVVTDDGVLRTVSLDDHKAGWTANGFIRDSIVTVTDVEVIAGASSDIIALDRVSGHERWRATTGGTDRVAVADGIAYVAGDASGRLTAVSLGDGTERWRKETGAARV